MTPPQPPVDRFERFTDRACAVMVLAHGQAERLGRDVIDTEHLLLAIAEGGEGIAAMALAAVHVSFDAIHAETVRRVDPRQPTINKSIPFSPAASDVLDGAEQEADAQGQLHVSTDHLLLALLGSTGGVASQVLASLGVTDDWLRAEIAELFAACVARPQTREEPTAVHVIGARRFAVPAALGDYNRRIAEARHQKETAVDAKDFEAAGEFRATEKRLLAEKRDLVTAWAAPIGTVPLVDEIDRLYRQAEQLRDLLRRNGIDGTTLTP